MLDIDKTSFSTKKYLLLQSGYNVKQFWKRSENFEENTCDEVPLVSNNCSELSACNITKTRTPQQHFPEEFPKIFRTAFLQNSTDGCF